MENIYLENNNALSVLRKLDNESIDLIYCDLPFGTTQNKWDSVLPLDKLWVEYKRILKPRGIVILFAQIPFSITLGASNLKWLKYEWIWDKKLGSGSLNVKKMPLKRHENILVFAKGKTTYNPQMTKGKFRNKSTSKPQSNKGNYGEIKHQKDNFNDDYYPTSILEFTNANVRSRIHPTEKQLPLMEYLVKTYTNEGDMVLDNTMGSGTTNLACLKLNRKSIGIEKEKQYYDVAVRRLSSYCG